MSPTGELQGLYQDMPLTNLASRRRRFAGLIVPRLMPTLNVNRPTGLIYQKDPKLTSLKVQDTVRAIGGEAKPLYGSKPTTADYAIEDHSLTDLLPDEIRIADTVLADDLDSVTGIMEMLDLEREVKVPAQIKAAIVAAGYTATPTEKFDAASPTVDPITYVNGQIAAFVAQTGIRPNVMAMSVTVASAIINHTKFIERAKYTLPPASMTNGVSSMESMLAAIFSITEVVIAEGHVQNTAAKGADAVLEDIWSDDILLLYKEPASTRYAGFGLEMLYTGFMNAPGSSGVKQVINGYVVEKARNARRYSDEFFVHRWYDEKIINVSSGRIITDVLT